MNQYTIQNTEDFEAVLAIKFPILDVLETEPERIKRKASLIKAATLESISKTNVILYVASDDGCQKLKSRIIATGDNQILIERGFALPISSIYKVDFI